MSWVLSEVLSCQQPLWLEFPWCPSCRLVTWPEFLLQPDPISQHTSLPQISTRILCSVVSQASVIVKLSVSLVDMLGCWAVAPQHWSNNFPIVCVVLILEGWNYCFGEQVPNSPLSSSQCLLKRVHWIIGCGIPCNMPPCGKGIYIKWQHVCF